MNPVRLRCPVPAVWLFCGALSLIVSNASAQVLDQSAWVANGTVSAVARDGNTLYVGGDFTNFGPRSGGFVNVSTNTGGPSGANPNVAGQVYAVIMDNASGWYVAGSFDAAGGAPRTNLAYQRADGTWDAWSPVFDGTIYTLVLKNGLLYVGGRFSNVDGQVRRGVAVFDATTRALTSWTANLTGQAVSPPEIPSVSAIEVTATSVYLGGNFYRVNDVIRPHLAEVSLAADTVTNWAPYPDSWVNALAVSGNTIYAGGTFTTLGLDSRPYLAQIDLTTGTATAWSPSPNDWVHALALDGTGALYVGGDFTSVSGVERVGAACLNLASGTVTAWNPNVGGSVQCIRRARSTVYLSGDFAYLGNTASRGFGVVDNNTGAVLAAMPQGPNGSVRTIGLGSYDGLVRLGGLFTAFGGVARARLAAIDLTTGQPTSWNPGAEYPIRALAIAGGRLFAGGAHPIYGALDTRALVAFDLQTGAKLAWDSQIMDTVWALAPSNGVLHVGGHFVSAGGATRNRAAAFDLTTMALTDWNPNLNSTVRGLAATDAHVYLAGDFTTVGGVTQRRAARVNRSTGTLDAGWAPVLEGNACSIAPLGARAWIGGWFAKVGGVAHPGLAALDTTTGALDPTASAVQTNRGVLTLALAADAVHVGGLFQTLAGADRKCYGAVDAGTLAPQPWSFDLGGATTYPYASAILADPDLMVLGGRFSAVNATSAGHLAIVRYPAIAVAQTVMPPTLSAPVNVATGTCTGRVLIEGVTSVMGPTPGLIAQLGYGPAADAPSAASWVWTDGSFSTDISGSEDWTAAITAAHAGSFAYGWRFSYRGGAWVYADLDGNENGWSAAQAGALTVTAPPVGWCNTVGPAALSAGTYHASAPVTGGVWMDGITEAWGGDPDLVAQLGSGPEGTDPVTSGEWSWTNATWSGQDGGNDVYSAPLIPVAVDTLRYCYRYRYLNSTWTYADLDGTGNGFDPANTGTLTVFAQSPELNAVLLTPPQLIGTIGEGTRLAWGHFTVLNVPDPYPHVDAQLGFGPAGTLPDTSSAWSWRSAAYDPYFDGLDDWATFIGLTAVAPGSYQYCFRFRWNGGPWAYGDLDGSSNGYSPAQAGALTVSAAPTVSWGEIDTTTPLTVPAGETSAPVQARSWTWPLAEKTALTTHHADIGWGPHGTVPGVSGGWTWKSATMLEDQNNGTRTWTGTLSPALPGEYDWCFRFRRDSGPFTYADLDGTDDGYELDAAARLTVTGTLDAGDRLPGALAFDIGGANPARAGIALRLGLPEPARVSVTIHDVAGRCVGRLADDVRGAGWHTFEWRPATGMRSAVWFARLRAGEQVIIRRFVTLE